MLAVSTGRYRHSNRRPHGRRDGAGGEELISRHQWRMDQVALVTRSSPANGPIVAFFLFAADSDRCSYLTRFHPQHLGEGITFGLSARRYDDHR